MIWPVVFKLWAELLIQPAYIGSRSSNTRQHSVITITIFWVMFTCCHFFFLTGKTYWWNSFWFKLWKRWPYWIWIGHWTSDQRWLIWQWIGYSLFWLCSVSPSEFLYLLCRMGSGSTGNVRWWKAEVEDSIKAWLWASRLAAYYSWYVFFFLIFSARCLLSIRLW